MNFDSPPSFGIFRQKLGLFEKNRRFWSKLKILYSKIVFSAQFKYFRGVKNFENFEIIEILKDFGFEFGLSGILFVSNTFQNGTFFNFQNHSKSYKNIFDIVPSEICSSSNIT